MKLSDFLKDAGVISTNLSTETEFDGITSKSREAGKRVPFICLKGERTDGHLYIADALSRGAAVILERLPENFSGKYILCTNTRRAYAVICSNLNGNPERQLKLIGVTGTNGKTSVCHMIKAILEEGGKKCAMVGTVKNYIGGLEYPATMTTPMPEELYFLMKKAVDAGDEYFIAEVSSHALEYEKFHPVTFTLSVFTNLTPEHLDFHGNMENYAAAKAKLFKKSLVALINEDDAYGKYMYDSAPFLKYYYSALRTVSDFVSCDKKSHKSEGIEYHLLGENEALHIISGIPGEFSFPNTLAAACGARLLGIECKDISMGIRKIKGIDGRMERVSAGSDIEVFVDYAHTPDALENLLHGVRGFSEDSPITLVFGCGGDRDPQKRPIMGAIAVKYAHRVVLTNDNTRSEDPQKIIDDILSGITENREKVVVLQSRKQALEYAVMSMEKGGTLIVAGKGHENYEIDRTGKHIFDEKKIIKEVGGQAA